MEFFPDMTSEDEIQKSFLAKSLSVNTVDKGKLEKEILVLYKLASIDPPKEFVWFDNPVSVSVFASDHFNLIWDQEVFISLIDKIYNEFRKYIDTGSNKAVIKYLRQKDFLKYFLLRSIAKSKSIHFKRFDDPMTVDLMPENAKMLNLAHGGVFTVNLVAYSAYLLEVIHSFNKRYTLPDQPAEILNNTTNISNLLGLGFYWPCEDICIVSQPPLEIYLNENMQFHHTKKPALLYPDGTKYYAICNYELPESVMPLYE